MTRSLRAVVEAAYVRGCKDAQRLAADVARRESRQSGQWSERSVAARAILDGIEALDPTRARPALEVLLAEPGGPTAVGRGSWEVAHETG